MSSRSARRGLLLLVLALGVVSLALAGSAGAATIIVHPGESIQAAIDAANPGDTILVEPGTYRENLAIGKDRITLKSDKGLGTVLLAPAKKPLPNPCISDPQAIPGICIFGVVNPDGSLGPPVNGTRVDGFVVQNFSDFGVILFNAADSAVTNTESKKNGSYGISGFVLSGIRFQGDIAHDNGEPGFYIGDSPHAKAVVVGNRSFRNGVGGPEGFGFLFRDSSHGVFRFNFASDNCAGFVLVDSGENPAPFNDWTGAHNVAVHNNGSCTGEQGGPPPTSGIGFGLLGTHKVSLHTNIANDNVPTGPTLTSGGIDLVSTAMAGGADPSNNVIAHNTAFGNSPNDIFWDESGSGNTFVGNNCGTSQPSWICNP